MTNNELTEKDIISVPDTEEERNKIGWKRIDEMTDLPLSERDFLSQVIDLAKLFRWKIHHTRPAWSNKGWRTPIQGDTGFPDLVLVRSPKCIIAELKSEKGKLSPNQEQWLRELSECPGICVCVWKPSQFDEIVDILK